MEKSYTFDDVSLMPQYSEIKSRSDCDTTTKLSRNFDIRNPIIATPMDTICELDMALEMDHLGGFGIIHRFMDIKDQVKMIRAFKAEAAHRVGIGSTHADSYITPVFVPRVGAAIGINSMARAQALVEAGADVLMIDVAHADHKLVYDTIKEIQTLKKKFTFDLIVGTIATRDAALRMANAKVDGVIVGVGGGCFTPDMKVKTADGLKYIKDIVIGDFVYSHDGSLQRVIDTLIFDKDEEIMNIDGIKCTKNHEFYVVHKKYASIVDEQNIHKYAQWIEAQNLTKDFLLVEN